jgi:peptidoglycan/xylan/chitin deacetylase (PgdA/CDA1 family)
MDLGMPLRYFTLFGLIWSLAGLAVVPLARGEDASSGRPVDVPAPIAVPTPVPVSAEPPSMIEMKPGYAEERPKLQPEACSNRHGLGVSRVVEIDTRGGPGYGFHQFKMNDFLAEKEIVLTFDDGPLPAYTLPVLKALDAHCVKATFFIVGRMALAYPETVMDTAQRGHTIGTHTWSHANLGARQQVPKRSETGAVIGSSSWLSGSASGTTRPATSRESGPVSYLASDKAVTEIELGFGAVARAAGHPIAPFFRFPYLGQSQAMLQHLAGRDIAVFSIDVDSLDYRLRSADEMVRRTLADLGHTRKGILLFHDIQPATAHGLPRLLDELKARGYRVVHMVPKRTLPTLAAYDAMAEAEASKRLASATKKPASGRMVWSMNGNGSSAPTGSLAAPAASSPAATADNRPRKPLKRAPSESFVPPEPAMRWGIDFRPSH